MNNSQGKMKRTVFYIKPNEQSAALLQSVINDLAKACNGPTFSPHMTFYTGLLSENESTEALLKSSIANVEPFLLRPKHIKFSKLFTRIFYLSFEISETLKNLKRTLKAQTKFPTDYDLNPHLSLAYTTAALDTRKGLAEKIDQFNEPILFDRVGALQTPDTVTNFKDIQNSNHIRTFKLGS